MSLQPIRDQLVHQTRLVQDLTALMSAWELRCAQKDENLEVMNKSKDRLQEDIKELVKDRDNLGLTVALLRSEEEKWKALVGAQEEAIKKLQTDLRDLRRVARLLSTTCVGVKNRSVTDRRLRLDDLLKTLESQS